MEALMQNNLSRAEMTAHMREVLVMELASVIALRLSARVVQDAHAPEARACLAACAEVSLRRYAELSERLAEIDVEPIWDPAALRGLSDRLAAELAKDRSADGLASRALAEVLALLYRYQELARTARHALDTQTKELLGTFIEKCDRQAAALARLIEMAVEGADREAA